MEQPGSAGLAHHPGAALPYQASKVLCKKTDSLLRICRASPFLKNGQDQWPLHTGQDFLPNHMVDGIDFASLHLWPDNWARTDEYFGRCALTLSDDDA